MPVRGSARVAMTSTVFVKHYADHARGVAARAHHGWLDTIAIGVRLPRLFPGTAAHLVTERLTGRHPGPDDLVAVAAALGRMHGHAHATQLHAARLDQPFTSSGGITIADFHTSRRRVLSELGIQPRPAATAFYKDANLRNFVLTGDEIAVVDFDDLTLAPFGYDLAKLVVSTAMTHGRLDTAAVDTAVTAYNRWVAATGGPHDACTWTDLACYAEVHHVLTAAYLHRHGYRHAWPTVRPWSAPLAAQAC